jgi:SAM-dependent methyltransferase
MSSLLYDILEYPMVYRCIQALLAPGQDSDMVELLHSLPPAFAAGRTLDVGCGPSSWLNRIGIRPVGLDVNVDYLRRFMLGNQYSVAGSASALPFCSRSFDCATSFGVLHHLPDAAARDAVRDMVRVVRPGGYVFIFDAVYPRSVFHRPLPYALRRLDRGRHVRTEFQLRNLIGSLLPSSAEVRRTSFSLYGLEALVFLARIA